MKVGLVGCPPDEALWSYRGSELFDLDNDYPGIANSDSDLLPKNVCAIIKRIIKNGLALPLDVIVYDLGQGKCDAARVAVEILTQRLDIPVIKTMNHNKSGKGTPVSDSSLTLREKARRILDGLLIWNGDTLDVKEEPLPKAAIWGVPAADLSIYDLFPPGTKLLGWFRCLENRTPADLDFELYVEPGIPTVFFAQTFCHKNILAKELAKRYGGLYVDADGSLTNSTKAKIEAFLRFNGAG